MSLVYKKHTVCCREWSCPIVGDHFVEPCPTVGVSFDNLVGFVTTLAVSSIDPLRYFRTLFEESSEASTSQTKREPYSVEAYYS